MTTFLWLLAAGTVIGLAYVVLLGLHRGVVWLLCAINGHAWSHGAAKRWDVVYDNCLDCGAEKTWYPWGVCWCTHTFHEHRIETEGGACHQLGCGCRKFGVRP